MAEVALSSSACKKPPVLYHVKIISLHWFKYVEVNDTIKKSDYYNKYCFPFFMT